MVLLQHVRFVAFPRVVFGDNLVELMFGVPRGGESPSATENLLATDLSYISSSGDMARRACVVLGALFDEPYSQSIQNSQPLS
jgi:hypothetical protein